LKYEKRGRNEEEEEVEDITATDVISLSSHRTALDLRKKSTSGQVSLRRLSWTAIGLLFVVVVVVSFGFAQRPQPIKTKKKLCKENTTTNNRKKKKSTARSYDQYPCP